MQRAKNEVTGLRGHERDLDRGAIAHFADQNYFGCLAQCGPQPVRVIVEVVPQLPLIEGRFEFWMNVFDRVLERDDMHGLRLVNLIEDRGQSGCLSAPGSAGDQDQPSFFSGNFVENAGKPEELDRRHFCLKFSKHYGKMPLLPEDVHAKTGFITQ